MVIGEIDLGEGKIKELPQVARYVQERWTCETRHFTVTHWLKRTTIQPQGFSEEDLRNAFNAGINFQRCEMNEWNGGPENEKPDFKDYLNSLKQG
jgi:hypothetical protein